MRNDPWAYLERVVAGLDAEVDASFVPRARTFLTELEAWTRVRRLTGYGSLQERVDHLLVDSLLFLRVIPEPASPLADVGTGIGIPGLVLQLARPGWTVWFVEANRRRANFVRHVLRVLGLAPAAVFQERAEVLGQGALAQRAATVTMRAVTPAADARRLVEPMIRRGGHVVMAIGSGAIGPGVTGGRLVRVARPPLASKALPPTRAFLIIGPVGGGTDSSRDVSRGTVGASGTHPGSGEPEGRRR